MKSWTPEETDARGKVAIVTGANSGIGLETARSLARAGAHTILACRTPEKAQAALADIRATDPEVQVEFMPLDLASLASVEGFAEAFLARFDRLDVLVNNAGVMMTPRRNTEDGHELQFGTNHLGHFALTARLLPRLLATPGARVVAVSSLAHWFGRLDLDNLNAERRYRRAGAYFQSKLANLSFALELQRRFEAAGVDVVSVAAHPGWTHTNLVSETPTARFLAPHLGQTAERGALPSLYAALAAEVRGGEYYGPSGLFEIWGGPSHARISRRARDQALGAELWTRSESLTGLAFRGLPTPSTGQAEAAGAPQTA